MIRKVILLLFIVLNIISVYPSVLKSNKETYDPVKEAEVKGIYNRHLREIGNINKQAREKIKKGLFFKQTVVCQEEIKRIHRIILSRLEIARKTYTPNNTEISLILESVSREIKEIEAGMVDSLEELRKAYRRRMFYNVLSLTKKRENDLNKIKKDCISQVKTMGGYIVCIRAARPTQAEGSMRALCHEMKTVITTNLNTTSKYMYDDATGSVMKNLILNLSVYHSITDELVSYMKDVSQRDKELKKYYKKYISNLRAVLKQTNKKLENQSVGLSSGDIGYDDYKRMSNAVKTEACIRIKEFKDELDLSINLAESKILPKKEKTHKMLALMFSGKTEETGIYQKIYKPFYKMMSQKLEEIKNSRF